MNRKLSSHATRLSLVAIAVAQACQVFGQELDAERVEAIAAAASPQNEVVVGFGYLSDASRRFGMYSGLTEEGGYLNLGVGINRLDKDTGTWFKFSGRDLGQANRELNLEYSRQGQWRYLVGFSQTPRYEPMVVRTGISGIGSTSVAVNGTAIRPVDLKIERQMFSAGVDHALDRTLAVRVRFTHETKDGARLYGRGTSGAIEFLPEAVDRTTETLELSLSHTGRDLQLSGGYYGTLFVNHADALSVSGGASALNTPPAPTPAFTPMSAPLDNNSHQLFLTGGYNVTRLTRASFKVSQTVAQQNENFVSVAPAATFAGSPASLNGRVDTLLAYVDLTSMEFDRLDLQANVRFEDRDDKTPEAQYMTAAAPNANLSGVTGFNKPRSWASLKSKLEAGYQLPEQFKLVGGWELEHQRRNAPESFRKVNFRQETDESTARVELKRSWLDTLSGGVSYSQARRTGSAYLPDTYTVQSGAVNPLLWADRERSAWKASFDWAPAEEWAVHLVREKAHDHYDGMELGPRDGNRMFTSIDASYALSERWHAHLWWSYDDISAAQATQVNPTLASTQRWQANLRQLSEGVGAGLSGKTRKDIELGVDVSYSKQRAVQQMQALTGSPVTTLPDYYYRLTEFHAFGVYPLDKRSGLRLDYTYYDWQTNDWTWNGWTYTDGTTLTQDYTQRTHFVGGSYFYRWY